LSLTEDQAGPRIQTGSLKILDGDVYEIITEVTFKAGEVIGCPQQPSRLAASFQFMEVH